MNNTYRRWNLYGMARSLGGLLLIATAINLASCAERTAGPAAQPKGESRPSGWSRSQLEPLQTTYRDVVVAFIPEIGSDDLAVRTRTQRAFESICMQSASSGREGHRWALCLAIVENLDAKTPQPARLWLVRKLEQIGGAESVTALSGLLTDPDTQIRDAARRALSINPAASATSALESALRNTPATEVEWRTSLVNALRGRGLSDKLYAYVGELTKENNPVGLAAISLYFSTLGTGSTSADDADINSKLDVLQRETNSARRESMAAALLRAAAALQGGDRSEVAGAAAIYHAIIKCDLSHATMIAALRGASLTGDGLPKLLEMMQGDDAATASEAASIAIELPGDAETRKLVERIPDLPPAIQVQLLDNLADRGSKPALAAAMAVWNSNNDDVRMAAIRTIGTLGSAVQAPRLIELAATTRGPERDAARRALARIPGHDVDQLITSKIEGGEPGYRVEAIRAAGARYLKATVPELTRAAGDSNEDIRVAAFNALGDLSGPSDLPALIDLLVRDPGDRSTTAAEDTVVAVANRSAEGPARAAPVLAKLDTAPSAGRPVLIRTLGRLGGEAALAAIRKSRESGPEAEVDAAVRALAKWPDAAVLGDLEQIAKSTSNDAHRSLALRAYFRLLKSVADKTPDQRMELVQRVLPAARTTDDRKALLGALGDIRHAEALALASSALGEEELRDEAALATVAAARRLAADQPAAARAAIEKARAATLGESARKAVDEAAEFVDKFNGYISAWQYAGPYFKDGLDFKGVFETSFPPEQPDGGGADWKPLPPSSNANPWILDLTQMDKGANRCLYVRAWVWSEHQQDARLDTGSDDALKAWVNGESVLAKPGQRSTSPGDDKTPIALHEGWNVVMLKVVQSSGGWDFCCGVRARDGSELPGLKFKAEP